MRIYLLGQRGGAGSGASECKWVTVTVEENDDGGGAGEPQRLAILLTLSSPSQLFKFHLLRSINNIRASKYAGLFFMFCRFVSLI